MQVFRVMTGPLIRFGIWVFLAAMMVNASSISRAEILPDPESFVRADERPLFEMVAKAMADIGADDTKSMLKLYDRALAGLPRPTKFRGYIQFSRAAALLGEGREDEAIEAVEESIRLLPEATGPLLFASGIFAYSDEPERSANYFIRASQLAPGDVRQISDYEAMGLVRRLGIKHEDRTAAEFSARLLEIGWTGSKVSSRSTLALKVMQSKLLAGNPDDARRFTNKLVAPQHSRTLLIGNAYRDIWNDIEEWSGPKLALQWTIYLNEARARWQASEDPELLGDYLSALAAARHDVTILREILPLFNRRLDKSKDYEFIFLAGTIARPLMRGGRWAELNALYARLEAIWPLGSEANALNLAANHAVWLLYEGRPREALAKMDRVIKDAGKRAPEVDSMALAQMHLQRACMLHELGRGDETLAIAPMLIATGKPAPTASYFLCANDLDKARVALINGLADPSTRDDVLRFVQENEDSRVPSDYLRKMQQRNDALRNDPLLLTEVAKYGRILPWTLAEGAPQEQVW